MFFSEFTCELFFSYNKCVILFRNYLLMYSVYSWPMDIVYFEWKKKKIISGVSNENWAWWLDGAVLLSTVGLLSQTSIEVVCTVRGWWLSDNAPGTRVNLPSIVTKKKIKKYYIYFFFTLSYSDLFLGPLWCYTIDEQRDSIYFSSTCNSVSLLTLKL